MACFRFCKIVFVCKLLKLYGTTEVHAYAVLKLIACLMGPFKVLSMVLWSGNFFKFIYFNSYGR
jgi:hypothetical protein